MELLWQWQHDPLACRRKNIFYASTFTSLSSLRSSYKVTEKRWQKANVSCLDLTYDPDTPMGINDSSTIYGEAEWKRILAELLQYTFQVLCKLVENSRQLLAMLFFTVHSFKNIEALSDFMSVWLCEIFSVLYWLLCPWKSSVNCCVITMAKKR